METKRIYIQPDCEMVDPEPFMEGVGINNMTGDQWTFTNDNTFDEDEEGQGSENNSIIWE